LSYVSCKYGLSDNYSFWRYSLNEEIDPDLFQRDGGVNLPVLNSYCWMYANFNIPPDFKVEITASLGRDTNL
jgi:hypothetical protein